MNMEIKTHNLFSCEGSKGTNIVSGMTRLIFAVPFGVLFYYSKLALLTARVPTFAYFLNQFITRISTINVL